MLKRKMLLLLLSALLLTLLTGTALADTLRFGAIDGYDTVNLRQQASSSSKWLGSYDEGTWMRILDDTGLYYKVKAPDGKTGYMNKRYIRVTTAAMGTIGLVDDAGYLNLRKSASSSSKVLGQYDDGTPCILLSEVNDWYHVSVDGRIGYFDKDYVATKYMAYSPNVATVVTDNGGALRMRKGPGEDYGTLRSFANYSYVMILQKGDGWWKVTADGKIGYMDASFLKDGIVRKPNAGSTGSSGSAGNSGSSGSSALDGSKVAYVSNPNSREKLNLRTSASRSSKSLGRYGNGTQVALISTGSTWCKVKVDGQTGYMMTKYLSLTKPSGSTGSSGSSALDGSKVAYVSNPDSRDKLNLRASASKGSKSLGLYGNGTRVTLISTGSTWCKVKVDGQTGYMMTRYLSLTKPNTGSTSGSLGSSDTAYVNNPNSKEKLNLRLSPSKSSRSLGRYGNGTKVTLLEAGAQWCKVRVDGKTGYMMTEFLTLRNTSGVPGMWVEHPDRTYVNLRRDASQSSAVLVRVPHGSSVTVLTPGKYWTKLRYEGYTGYMMTRYLSD